jgi:hypothetical protein
VPAEVLLTESRLIRLAAAVSGLSVSSREELYRGGLGAEHSVPAVLRGSGAAARQVTPAGVQRLVTARFPDAAPIPPRPALDELVDAAGLGLRWDGAAYVAPSVSAVASRSSTQRSSHLTSAVDQASAQRLLDARLRGSLNSNSYVVLTVDPRHADLAADRLAADFGVTVVDLSRELLKSLREAAARYHIEWRFLLGVDAQQPGTDRNRLDGLVQQTASRMLAPLLARPEPILMTEAGLLGRYRATSELNQLADLAAPNPAARWLLLPHRSAEPVPTLDGTPVALTQSGPVRLPSTWVLDGPLLQASRIGIEPEPRR